VRKKVAISVISKNIAVVGSAVITLMSTVVVWLKKAVTSEDIDKWFEDIKEETDSKQSFSMEYTPENISLLKGGFVSPSKKSGTASQI
jgi:phage-related minor tail protein